MKKFHLVNLEVKSLINRAREYHINNEWQIMSLLGQANEMNQIIVSRRLLMCIVFKPA